MIQSRPWRIELAELHGTPVGAAAPPLKKGWVVKLLFSSRERIDYLWVKVVRVSVDKENDESVRYTGVVKSDAAGFRDLEIGTVVEFVQEQIFDYVDVEEKARRR